MEIKTRPKHTALKCFYAVLEAYFRRNERGSQARVAKQIGMDRSQFNRLISRQDRSDVNLMEEIASVLGLSFVELIYNGERILEGKPFFPFHDQLKGLSREEQAFKIVDLTNNELGVQGCLSAYRPSGFDDFIDGNIGVAEFYERYLSDVEAVIDETELRDSTE